MCNMEVQNKNIISGYVGGCLGQDYGDFTEKTENGSGLLRRGKRIETHGRDG